MLNATNKQLQVGSSQKPYHTPAQTLQGVCWLQVAHISTVLAGLLIGGTYWGKPEQQCILMQLQPTIENCTASSHAP